MSTGSSAQHDALAAMYQSHHGWLRTWLQRRLGNTADAADLAQDAFLRLLAADGDAIQAVTVREPSSSTGTRPCPCIPRIFTSRPPELRFSATRTPGVP
ncbi:hypothetical protein EHF36_01560 [Kerstersia gyiorum]|nr:hypothetical protein EHF36_01560 [Kerstersia gyiorum]